MKAAIRPHAPRGAGRVARTEPEAAPVTADLDCRTCGACCVGDMDDGYGFADCTEADVARMSRAARRRLTVVRSGWAGDAVGTPAIVTEELGKSCGFLRGTPGRRVSCRIYESRPDACRRYRPGGPGCRAAREALGL